MTLEEKIDFLGKMCDNSLSFMQVCNGWNVHAYKRGTRLRDDWYWGKTLIECIDNALEDVVMFETNKKEKGVKRQW